MRARKATPDGLLFVVLLRGADHTLEVQTVEEAQARSLDEVEQALAEAELTYVPIDPFFAEWSFAVLGEPRRRGSARAGSGPGGRADTRPGGFVLQRAISTCAP